MTESMEWNDIAASELPSLDSGAENVWSRNLSQLQIAGQSLLQEGGSGISFGNQQGRQPGFGDVQLRPQISTTSAQPQLSKFNRPYEPLEDTLSRYESSLIESVVQETADEARERTKELIEAQIQTAWVAERDRWIRDLVGTRSLGRSAARETPNLLTSSSSHNFRTTSTGEMVGLLPQSQDVALDMGFVENHWRVVVQMKNRTIKETVQDFSRVAESLKANRNYSNLHGYVTCWQLVANLAESASKSPTDLARATLIHLCNKFQTRMCSLVSQKAQNSLIAHCQAFSEFMLGNSDPWAIIYFCLHCGDAVSAASIPEQYPEIDPSVKRALGSLARIQGNLVTLWQSNTPIAIDPSDRREIQDLLESSRRSESQNPHKQGVYFLLAPSGDPINFDAEGFKNIENFLMQALWKALSLPNPIDELISLSEYLQDFGPTHFDDPSTGGWSFALPLMVVQQYQTALSWLDEKGGSMGRLQAAHIAIALSYAGIQLRNLGTTDVEFDERITVILVDYANSKEVKGSIGPLASLDYLVRIPNAVRGRKEVAKLVASVGDMEKLAGSVSHDGRREGGALAEHFNPIEVSYILVDAAEMLSTDRKAKDRMGAAMMCLLRAERYADLLTMLNGLLTPPNKPDEDRQFWLGQCEQFHVNFTNRQTNVLTKLEEEDKLHLIRSSKILIDLNLYFKKFVQPRQSAHDCLRDAENLGLLPTSESDGQMKAKAYRNLDPMIKEAYPSLLVSAMELLLEEHSRLKRELQTDRSGVIRERIKEIQNVARLYTSFASSVGIPTQFMMSMTRMESLMI